jgi:putative ABC transport system permease protein
MDRLLQNLRYAVRTLRKAPGFTALVVLTLALGIGANTAIFSVVNALLLRPLPYQEPDRLVRLYETFPLASGEGQGSVSVPNFLDWREQTRTFDGLAAYSDGDVNLQGVDRPERLSSVTATANLFSLLGARPRLGRTFVPTDDEPGAPPVVVLSEGLWEQRFGGDPGVLGETILLDGQAHTVVGVMPERFRFPAGAARTDVWLPLKFTPSQAENRGSHWMAVLGRLRPGATLEAAGAEMSQIAARIEEQYPDQQEGRGIKLVPLRETVVGKVRPALLVLLGAAGLVLLIACANAANLLLARSAARRREIAIRTALGAGRGRVIGQFLTEALLLALAGAVLGLALAAAGIRVLVGLAGPSLPRAGEIGFDAGVVAFLVLVTGLTAVGFGLAPALQASGIRLHEDLKEGSGKASAGRSGQRFRSALVVSQIALSLVLLIGAGLLMKTFVALLSTETGMQTENVLTMNVSIPAQRYPDATATARFFDPVLEQVRSLPEVAAAGWTTHLPLQAWGLNGPFTIEGRPAPATAAESPRAEFRGVSSGYFAALNIPLLRGRGITAQDAGDAPPVLVVNQTLAERYFPDGDPIGQRILLWDGFAIPIAGVVGDVRQAELTREPLAELYAPHSLMVQFGLTDMTLVVSTRIPSTTIAAAAQRAIEAVDPEQPVYNVQTMEQVVANSVSDRRLYLWLLGTFAAVALALAIAGIYGVIAYAVTQRTREFGIRIALGAQTASVLGLVLRHGAKLAVLGLLIGLPAAFALTRVLGSLLYGVSATDPVTFISVALLLISVALLASYLPAHRATRVNPTVALRAE